PPGTESSGWPVPARKGESDVILVSVVTAALVIASVFLHLGALLRLSARWPMHAQSPPQVRVALMVLAVIVVHLVEIALFAVGMAVLSEWNICGQVRGTSETTAWRDYFYFSAFTYTTLGGHHTATGDLRLLIAVESLAGLVLITWTASFFFLVMQRFWHLDVAT